MPPAGEKARGAIELRSLKAAAIEPDDCGFPFARQVIEAGRRIIDKKTGELKLDAKTGLPKIEIRHFITSLAAGEASPEKLAELIRGHWSVENKNHWRRDASRWREDACRLRRPRAAQNFGLLRNAMLALIPSDGRPLDAVFDHHTRYPRQAIKLLNAKLRPSI